MSDILFRKDGFVFSYRVAGIAVQNGKVLLQKPTNEDFYAFPGGHVDILCKLTQKICSKEKIEFSLSKLHIV